MPFREAGWMLGGQSGAPLDRWHSVSLVCPSPARSAIPRRSPCPRRRAPTSRPPPPAADEALVEESLVEEVSIDGMCGVY
ncbi:mycofactocin precursor MftA [Blastococcus sp. TML/M2B]|uniref:mycofactocin precursor MftA n=1 Tax=Blastococcus sp. TML/M2B TaxID=2798727 RepID=UPI0028156664|nr:mycofactocin precursor MftA [Blastococcus sp. TML/M2B]